MKVFEMTSEDLSMIIRKELLKVFNEVETSKPESEFLTREEAAKLLNLSFATLWKLNNKGELKTIKVGRKVYYDSRAIEDFMRSKKS